MNKNPYANIDPFEEDEPEEVSVSMASDAQIRKSRELLCDPYAHLDEFGGYSATTNPQRKAPASHLLMSASSEPPRISLPNARSSRRYTDQQIEVRAKELRDRLWRQRMTIWDGTPPSDPVDLLDPAKALGLLGYNFRYEEELGSIGTDVEVAGIIDRDSKTAFVSRQFPMNVRAFTAAHELGHAVLHPSGGGVHRDRALDGSKLSREGDEYEADKFATYFLLPAKLVKSRFAELFGTERFCLTDDTAFALSSEGISDVRKKNPTPRHLSRRLAGASSYNGRYFSSLAEQFGVSIEAMAIRLEELSLIE